MDGAVLAIDQGTTSSRAIVFAPDQTVLGFAQQELPQRFPAAGWVEHDPDDIWSGVVATVTAALARARVAPADLAGIGITNQRETTLLWDRRSGRPIHAALVWQDRRTAEMCRGLRGAGVEPLVRERTGLLLDPYFSATKIAWLLDHVPGAREAAMAGRLAFGTVDSFLLWRLTGGRVHATDATNAARTLLFNIHRQDWDEDLLRVFDIPRALLPEVRDCAADFGTADAARFGGDGRIAIRGIAGDQHAATIGQACFAPGMVKATYGTGCFAVLNTGDSPASSAHKLLTTVAYRLGGKVTYALEGSIFVAGAAVQWLRDGLGLASSAREIDAMAANANPDDPTYLVPAFVGLGAPHWDPQARGALHGLTRGTGRHEIARAALESVGYQTRDLIEAMRQDWPGLGDGGVLRVDGGMAASDWTMQFIADMLAMPVDRPVGRETTSLGVAWLAGQAAGAWPDAAAFAAAWRRDRQFRPNMPKAKRKQKYAGWLDAVGRVLSR